MKFHFRPFLGLTLFTVLSIAILIGLGTWQYQRLQWKTNLLAEVEAAVTAPPLSSLRDVQKALSQGEPTDFRRIEFYAEILTGQTPFLVYSRTKRELSWRTFYAAKGDGVRAFLATGLVSDTERDKVSVVTDSAPQSFAGYVRLARAQERGAAQSTPGANRWFSFNPLPDTANWASGLNGEFAAQPIESDFYIDVAVGEISADTLPIKRPQIRNNHFDYMLTWYGLAVALFVIYLILHVQRGRLGFKTS